MLRFFRLQSRGVAFRFFGRGSEGRLRVSLILVDLGCFEYLYPTQERDVVLTHLVLFVIQRQRDLHPVRAPFVEETPKIFQREGRG